MASATDYLANERTFLAYVRTALAFQVAGLGVLQFLTDVHEALQVALGIALVLIGSFVAVAGLRSFRNNDRALRGGREVGRPGSVTAITLAVLVVPLTAAFLVALV